MYTTSTYRSWRRIDVTSFQEALRSSTLCTVDDDGDVDVQQLATLYDDVISDNADRLVPFKTATYRIRPSSDPWYDDACRQARRQCRHAERLATLHPEFAECSSGAAVLSDADTFENNRFSASCR